MTGPRWVAGAALLVFALFGSPAHGRNPRPPFVAAFERFARHDVIAPTTGGQLLLSELNCTTCHATDSIGLTPKGGPRLTGAGNRLRTDWIRAFLSSPAEVKPGTTMPDVLAHLPAAELEETVEALVAFLSTQQRPFPETKASGANPLPHEFWSKGDARRGQRLYHLVGCVACHEPDAEYQGGHSQPSAMAALLATLEPEDIEELGLTESTRPVPSVPLADLSAKYTSKALTYFLASPETTRPGSRMPNLKLELVEAADIAAYLTKNPPAQADRKSLPADASLVEKGRTLFSSLSCASCHEVEGPAAATKAKPLARLASRGELGCLDGSTSGLPNYGLDEFQVKSILAALGELTARSSDTSVDASLELSLLQRNCYACHERDERGGIGPEREAYFETVAHVDLGDEGRLPPPLDHVGKKLTAAWLAKVLEGTGDVRPHMHIRMPRYPQEVTERLPQAFADADRPAPVDEAQVFRTLAGLQDDGRNLLDNGCVQCHPIRGESASGVVGVDLATVSQRVRPQWFLEFLRNPAALKKRTRMPSFFPNGQSAVPDILHGDVDLQIAALWSYLKDVDTQRLPEKIEEARSQAFELVPHDRPIVIRTFMDTAGPHAIAVGFPERVHYAFDAERMRLAQAWRGRFLDAYGTWFVRSAPPATPLGSSIVSLPAGLTFAVLPTGDAHWPTGTDEEQQFDFLGYRFDPAGIPTFRYRYRGFAIADRIEPAGGQGLKRILRVTVQDDEAPEHPLWFRAHRGKELNLGDTTCSDPNGVVVRLDTPTADAILWHDPDGSQPMEWRVPVHTDRDLEVTYQW